MNVAENFVRILEEEGIEDVKRDRTPLPPHREKKSKKEREGKDEKE